MYRRGTEKDCNAVYNLICEMECKQLPIDSFSEIYREQIRDENYYCLVCECDGKVIGVLNLRFEKQLHHCERIAEIMEFAIASHWRNKGIGGEMFAQACAIAIKNGCIQIEAACNQLRRDTHRFYEKEAMRNFHFKFSKSLIDADDSENMLGR